MDGATYRKHLCSNMWKQLCMLLKTYYIMHTEWRCASYWELFWKLEGIPSTDGRPILSKEFLAWSLKKSYDTSGGARSCDYVIKDSPMCARSTRKCIPLGPPRMKTYEIITAANKLEWVSENDETTYGILGQIHANGPNDVSMDTG